MTISRADSTAEQVPAAFPGDARDPNQSDQLSGNVTPFPRRRPTPGDAGPERVSPLRPHERRFRLYSIAELDSLPAPTWLIQDVLPSEGLAALVGAYGTTKSFGALGVGLAVASGTAWLEREVRQGPVVYLAAEGGSGLPKRIRAWKQAHHVAGDLPFQVINRPVNLSSSDDVEQLIADIWDQSEPPALIVIDTLARSMPGVDENSAKDMGLVVASLDAIRRAFGECCVLLIHHTGKVGDSIRGSSALPGALDAELLVTRDRGQYPHHITLTCKKQKDAEEFAPIAITLTSITLDGAPGETSCVWALCETAATAAAGAGSPGPSGASMRSPGGFPSGSPGGANVNRQRVGPADKHDERALAALRTFGRAGTSQRQWWERANLAESTLKRSAQRLLMQKLVTKQDDQKPARWIAADQLTPSVTPQNPEPQPETWEPGPMGAMLSVSQQRTADLLDVDGAPSPAPQVQPVRQPEPDAHDADFDEALKELAEMDALGRALGDPDWRSRLGHLVLKRDASGPQS